MNTTRVKLVGVLTIPVLIFATSLCYQNDSLASGGDQVTGFWKVTLVSPKKEKYAEFLAILQEGNTLHIRQLRHGKPGQSKAGSKARNGIKIELIAYQDKDKSGIPVLFVGKFIEPSVAKETITIVGATWCAL